MKLCFAYYFGKKTPTKKQSRLGDLKGMTNNKMDGYNYRNPEDTI